MNSANSRYPERTPRRRPRTAAPSNLVWVLLFAFMLAALVTAFLTFVFVRTWMASRQAEAVPTPLVQAADATSVPYTIDPGILQRPLQEAGRPAPRAWDGHSRVNVLLMGLDYRDWEDDDGPSRTDTLMLLTLDPETQSAGMLSIPRDLWVNIPGFDYGKINTAYFLGEGYQVPGGGPALAVQTVEAFLAIEIHFYAQIDFGAFEQFIDELGGIELEVAEEISVDPIGPHNTVILEAGVHTLDGATALAYARNRNTAGNDFDRSARQQQVIMAIRKRILDLNMLPLLIEKSPILYSQLASGVHTNLNLEQIISLAWLAKQVPADNIQRLVIGFDYVVNDYSWDGQSILMPVPDQIARVRDQLFTVGATAPLAPSLPTGDPTELRRLENARISVLNGTYTPGLAARTMEYLQSEGIEVVTADNAQEAYELTSIIDYTGKIYTQQFLAQLMNVQPSQIFSRYDPSSEVDIVILLGSDWATTNPMP